MKVGYQLCTPMLCRDVEMDTTLPRQPIASWFHLSRKLNIITTDIGISFDITTRVMMKTFWIVKYHTEYWSLTVNVSLVSCTIYRLSPISFHQFRPILFNRVCHGGSTETHLFLDIV
jgi:hypothetical protein